MKTNILAALLTIMVFVAAITLIVFGKENPAVLTILGGMFLLGILGAAFVLVFTMIKNEIIEYQQRKKNQC